MVPSSDVVKFLLVDDLPENLLALEALLSREGLELHTARSGEAALELLLQHDFALALLDVQMPGMDGFELAELMRGTERTRRVPIIFLTAVATDEKRRFRGYEAGAIDYLFKPLDPQLLKNKADLFFALDCQKQQLASQRDALQASAERLNTALEQLRAHHDNSPLAVVQLDPDFRVSSWSQGAERMFGWAADQMIGKPLDAPGWIHEQYAGAFEALRLEILASRALRDVRFASAYRQNGTIAECEWYISALTDPNGRLISVNAQIQDITERKRAEETQQLLIGELNHRVKNMLATVQAIATQTLRHSGDPKSFSVNFAGRIQALARAHSLLSSATWKGAMLAELIEGQLQIGTVDERRLSTSGPEVCLPPQMALHLALILHELSTNANKYGALSSPTGQVGVHWTVEDGYLQLIWEEQGGPPVKAPTRRGFGSTLIEQSVKAEGGTSHASYRAEGIKWELRLSLPAAPVTLSHFGSAHGLEMPATTTAHQSAANRGLAGKRMLIVEDEPLVAIELSDILKEAGASVIGPAATAEQALQMIDTVKMDGALLDGNLRGVPVDHIAAALTRRSIPFVFVSGYGNEHLPQAFQRVTVVGKPFAPQQLLEEITKMLSKDATIIQMPGRTPDAVA